MGELFVRPSKTDRDEIAASERTVGAPYYKGM